jgi:hypothetical protein
MAFALALVLSVATFATSALADVIGAAPSCAPWEDAEYHHGSVRCTPRACVRNAQCSGAHCETRRVCVVREEVWVSRPGPCRDMDGDGECDRTRQMQDREAGVCPAEGHCAEGACQTRGNCHE